MANSKIKLVYFDLTGRAELIRLILTWADKKFEDCRIKREDWPKHKPNSPFGQLPYVEIDGKAYAQSLAIAQFFAAEFNLFGKSNIDRLKICQFAQLVEDFIQAAAKCFRETDEAKKAEFTKQFKEEVAPKYFDYFSKLYSENDGKHFVGCDFSLADLICYDLRTGFLSQYIDHVFDRHPKLKDLAERVGDNPRIKTYRECQKK